MHISNQKAIELFFPNQGKCYFDVDIKECEVHLTDSTGNILGARLILKNYLKENGLNCPRCILYYILSAKITQGRVCLVMMMYIPFSVTNLK